MGQKDAAPEPSQQDAEGIRWGEDLSSLAPVGTLGSHSQQSPCCRQAGGQGEHSQPQQTPGEPVKQLFNVSPLKSPPRSALSCCECRVACVAEPQGQRVRAMAVGSPTLLLVTLNVVHAVEGKDKRVPGVPARVQCFNQHLEWWEMSR